MNEFACYSPAGLAQYYFVPENLSLTCRLIMESVSQNSSLPQWDEYLRVFSTTFFWNFLFIFYFLRGEHSWQPSLAILSHIRLSILSYPCLD